MCCQCVHIAIDDDSNNNNNTTTTTTTTTAACSTSAEGREAEGLFQRVDNAVVHRGVGCRHITRTYAHTSRRRGWPFARHPRDVSVEKHEITIPLRPLPLSISPSSSLRGIRRMIWLLNPLVSQWCETLLSQQREIRTPFRFKWIRHAPAPSLLPCFSRLRAYADGRRSVSTKRDNTRWLGRHVCEFPIRHWRQRKHYYTDILRSE